MMARRWHNASASSMLCVVRRMVLPRWLYSRMMSQSSNRVCGSSPALGSSRKSTCGSCIMARDGEPLHHAAGKTAHHLVAAIGELEAIEQRARALAARLGIDAEIRAVEEKDFARGESKVEVRPLLHHSNQPLDHDLLRPHVMLADPGLAVRRTHTRGENSHRRRLTGAVWSQQSKDFSG